MAIRVRHSLQCVHATVPYLVRTAGSGTSGSCGPAVRFELICVGSTLPSL